MAISWGKPGIANSFEYWAVDPQHPDTDEGERLDGMADGGSITEAYRGDYRVTGTVKVEGGEVPRHRAVRIVHTAEQGGEVFTEVLATLLPEPMDCEFARGGSSGSVGLESAMAALDGDRRSNDRGMAAGTNIASMFQTIVQNSGQVPFVMPDVDTTRTLSSSHVWEFGDSVLSECHTLANACGCHIDVDERGRVVMRVYTEPARIAPSFGIDSDCLVGIDIRQPDIVNRVIATHTEGSGDEERVWYASARADVSHKWSFEGIGRWYTEEVQASSISKDTDTAQIQSILDSLVKSTLAERLAEGRTFSVEMPYRPGIRPGLVGSLQYDDGGGETLTVPKVFCSEREIELDGAMTMKLTLEEIV